MPIHCPQCGNQNEDGATFCDNCGTALTGAAPPPARPAAPAGLPPTAAVGAGLRCPQCGQPVVAGEAFCENCGAALTGMAPSPAPPAYPAPPPPAMPAYQPPSPQPAPPAYQPPPQPAPAPAGPATCPSCGTPATPGAAFCDNCGASLTGVPPAAAAAPPYPPPYPAPAAEPYPPAAGPPPRLMVQPSNTSLPFPASKAEIIAGREDPVSNVFPEINLDPHGGDEGGVSRRHAKFTLRGGQWYVEDLNSTNFTFVNKQKLQPGQPHPVNNGDEVRLGRVTMTFFTS